MNPDLKQNLSNIILAAPKERRAWLESNTKNSNIHRQAFWRIKALLDDFYQGSQSKYWFIMPGLRGVGKSTILTQLYLSLTNADYKFFLSLERIKLLGAEIKDILDVLEESIGKPLETFKQPVYLFLDEVQYLKDWALGLKVFYDRLPQVFIVCTGSSAIELQSNADVARRSLMIPIYPLDFKEYVNFKRHYNQQESIQVPTGLDQEIGDILFKSENHQSLFYKLQSLNKPVEVYWRSLDKSALSSDYMRFASLPFVLGSGLFQEDCWQMVDRLLSESLSKDATQSSNLSGLALEALETCLRLLAESDCISLHRLSKIMGLNKRTIVNMLKVLCNTDILNPISPLGSSYQQINKPSKYLFTSPALRLTLAIKAGMSQRQIDHLEGHLLEDMVGMYLKRIISFTKICYDAQPGGADFVIGDLIRPQSVIALEVGLSKNQAHQTAKTLQKIKGKYGLVVTNGDLKLDLEAKSVFVPLEYFLLI